jgi:hypothetical protein
VISEGNTTASAPSRQRVTYSKEQREVIRKHRRAPATTGSSKTTTTVTVGERLPDTVVLQEFEPDVVRVVPSVRSYRYVPSPNGVYLVDPGTHTVIEEID